MILLLKIKSTNQFEIYYKRLKFHLTWESERCIYNLIYYTSIKNEKYFNIFREISLSASLKFEFHKKTFDF